MKHAGLRRGKAGQGRGCDFNFDGELQRMMGLASDGVKEICFGSMLTLDGCCT